MMKGLNYWILGLIYIVGVGGIFANCAAQCDPKYNYAYLLESGGLNEPDLYCTKYFIDNTLIKKAKMPLRFCYLKNNFSSMSNSCLGGDIGSMLEAALTNVIDALNKVCDSDDLKLTKEANCYGGNSVVVDIQTKPIGHFKLETGQCYTSLGACVTYFPSGIGGLLQLNFTPEFEVGNGKEDAKCWSLTCYQFHISGKQCVDMTTVLMHEICHSLGLGHLDGVGGSGYDKFGNPCNTADSFGIQEPIATETMRHKLDESNYNQEDKISCYMRCALTKLYCPCSAEGFWKRTGSDLCCAITSVDDVITAPNGPNIELYPQPSSTGAVLKIQTTARQVQYELYSETGARLHNQTLEMDDTMKLIRIGTNDLASGVYYIVVSTKEGISSIRFIVRH